MKRRSALLGFGEAESGGKSGRGGLMREKRAAWDYDFCGGMGEGSYIEIGRM